MEERGASYVCDWRPNLLPGMDDVDSKSVNCISANVIPIDSRNQHLTLVVVDEQPSNHFDWIAETSLEREKDKLSE